MKSYESYHNHEQKKETLQVCDLDHALSVDADIHVDCTGLVNCNESQYIVFKLDVNAKDITDDDIISFTEKFCHKKCQVLISVKNFGDEEEHVTERCKKVVDLLINMVKRLDGKKNLVIRVNCMKGQNRSAVVACRYAASAWLKAPNTQGPDVYRIFKLLCKNYRPGENKINDTDPRGTFPKYGCHGTRWPHNEICEVRNRQENKYPVDGSSGGPRIKYDDQYTHTQLVSDDIINH